MITIKPQSWHYRVWKGRFETYQAVPSRVGICSYCSAIVGIMIGRTFEIITGVIGIFSMFAFAFMIPTLLLWGLYAACKWMAASHADGVPDKIVARSVLYLALVLIACAASVLAAITLKRKWTRITSSDAVQLTAAFLKAKKEKVCPILELPGNTPR